MPRLTTPNRCVPLVLLVVFLYVASGLIVSTSSLTYAAQELAANPVAAETPSVILAAGTAGTATIYANSTGAVTTVHAPATTYTPDGYALAAGTWVSGFVPASVRSTDADYFTVANGLLRYQLHPTGFDDRKTKWTNEVNAWDWSNATSATEIGGNVLNAIYWQSWNNSGSGTVLRVDLRVRLDLTGLVDDSVTVEWWVGGVQGSAPGSVVINSTTQGTDLLVAFDDCQEPTDGAWSWADVGNLELRLEGSKVGGADAVTYAVDEVWGWAIRYPASTAFAFTEMTEATPSQLNVTVVSEYTVASVNVTIQLWNFFDATYATSGEGYLNYLASGVNETKLLTLTTTAEAFTAMGAATVKVTGVLPSNTSFTQRINQLRLDYGYDPHSNVTANFSPTGYAVPQGMYTAGSTPASVRYVDADTFIVTSASTSTTALQYYPSAYRVLGGTTLASGSLANLTANDGTDMTFTSYHSGLISQDYVDTNTSDVDLSPDVGGHGNFTAQQYGPDATYDLVSEAQVPGSGPDLQIHPTGFDDRKTKWTNEVNAWDWSNATSATEIGGNVLNAIYWQSWNNSGSGTVLRVDLRVRLDLTGLVDDSVTVEWWVGGVQGSAPGSVVINSTTQGTDLLVAFDDCQEPTDGAWSWADVGNLELRLEGSKVGGADAVTYAVDEVWGWAQPASYQLDLEVQWTAAPFDETHEYLSISCGSLPVENLTVDAWWNSSWQPLLTDLSTGWNNVSVSSYLTNATFTIRFTGANETADGTLDSWALDAVLLRVWSDEYTGDVEFTGTSNSFNWQRLNWTVDSAWTTDAVQVTLQLYNYTAGQYPTSGAGYLNYTSGPADSDQLQLQALLTDVAAFRNATGGWQLRVTGVKATATPFDLNADFTEFTPVHHSAYTASTEFAFSNMISNAPPIQLNFTVVGHFNVSSVNATLQVWNYSASSYVTSGEGYATYTSDGDNVTTTLSVNANPEDCVFGGTAKLRFIGVLATEVHRQETNQVKLQYRYNVNTYAPVLTIANQVADAWQIRFSAYDQQNIARLTNCTLTLRNGGSSTQIQIVDGAYTQQQGTWIDLAGATSVDVDVRVVATVVDTSIIYVRLDILVPTISVYNQFLIAVQIT